MLFHLVLNVNIFKERDKMETLIVCPKYIYLDWNVIKYMKEPRNGKEEIDLQFKKTIFKLRKKYIFPFSEAHIEDRLNNYVSDYDTQIMEDFKFAISINNNKALGFTDSNELMIVEYDMLKAFNEIKAENLQSNDVLINSNFPSTFKVDFSKIPQNHPMYDFLLANDGQVSPKIVDKFLLYFYETIFNDTEKYKQFRKYLGTANIRNDLSQQIYSYEEVTFLDNMLVHCLPFLDSFGYDKERLLNNWKDITESWANLNTSRGTLEEKLILSYGLLDLHPLFNEKLKKRKNTLDNIRRDGKHCMFASKAEFFISEDAKTREKIAFIYKAFGIKTKVLSMMEFLNIFFVA